jgi:hypothetical protein
VFRFTKPLQSSAQNYKNEEIAEALGWADGIGLLVVVALSTLAEDGSRAVLALEKMKTLSGGAGGQP